MVQATSSPKHEFEHVVAVAANKGIIPLEAAVEEAEDAVAMRNAETGGRPLLYVALRRARRSATITGCGPMSPHLYYGVMKVCEFR